MTRDDGVWDYRRGYVTFPKHESDLPGHIFDAYELASRQGVVHVLEEASPRIGKTNLAREASTFQNELSGAYPPDVLLPRYSTTEIYRFDT
jgi:hypothetical protein